MTNNLFEKSMMYMTWPEIDRLAKEDAIVLWPLGVIEEHGYHLPLGTDIFLSMSQVQDIADVMEEQNQPYVIAPPYYWGTMQVVTKNFPGSFTATPEHIQGMIFDILESLENAGFTKVVGANCHGDGLHIKAIMHAFKEYNASHKLNVRYLNFEDDLQADGFNGKEDFVLAVPPYPFEEMVHGVEKIEDHFDIHAGAFETACMREAFPELTDMETAKKMKATMLDKEQRKLWMSGKPEYNYVTPEGHVGDPAGSALLTTEMTKANRVVAKQIIEFYQNNK